MLSGVHQGYLVVVHGAQPPAQADWERYLEDIRSWREVARGQLVHTLGGMPSSIQRASAITLGKEAMAARGWRMPPTSVMTDATAVRALATLFNWFLDDTFRAFALRDWPGAMAHLGVEPSRQDALRSVVEGMVARVR